jgi:hypothetical protein
MILEILGVLGLTLVLLWVLLVAPERNKTLKPDKPACHGDSCPCADCQSPRWKR